MLGLTVRRRRSSVTAGAGRGCVIEQASVVLNPGVMGDVDIAMALTEGTAFMGTGTGNVFGAFVYRLCGRPGFDDPGTAIEAKPPRPQAARIPALRALRPARRTLRCGAVVGTPPACGGGRLTRNADLCCDTAFSDAEIAERGAECAEPILLRPAVAVGRWRSACPCLQVGLGVQDNERQLKKMARQAAWSFPWHSRS